MSKAHVWNYNTGLSEGAKRQDERMWLVQFSGIEDEPWDFPTWQEAIDFALAGPPA